ASSAAVYGNVDVLPVAEDAPARPLSPYGIHKHLGEHYLRAWSALYGLSTTALRFFNVYGPRQDPKSPYSGVISIFIDRATRGAPLTIFGDGAQTRDFVFVTDVVAAIVAALFRPGATGQIFNVAGGNEVSVKALARRVIDLCGDQSEIVFAEGRSGEIARSLADTRLATDSLGFVPKVALSEGLTQTISWFLDASENPR
ncbi:MAG: UDP-glucose 4-epimerase, partial [Myxococcota bacterium]